MKIGIVRDGKNVKTVKDYSNIKDKGEVAHFLAELDIIKLDLLEIWEQLQGDEEGDEQIDINNY